VLLCEEKTKHSWNWRYPTFHTYTLPIPTTAGSPIQTAAGLTLALTAEHPNPQLPLKGFRETLTATVMWMGLTCIV
jgi:hypothetical protein